MATFNTLKNPQTLYARLRTTVSRLLSSLATSVKAVTIFSSIAASRSHPEMKPRDVRNSNGRNIVFTGRRPYDRLCSMLAPLLCLHRSGRSISPMVIQSYSLYDFLETCTQRLCLGEGISAEFLRG